ncbi:MAG: hypothetical protein K2K00_08055 [Muribaculaceae bacterium]|nr:hypothetical protein [Muribaculaceae bacterium]
MLNFSKSKSQKAMVLGHIGAIITVAIWGGSFVSTKVLLDNGLNPS